MTQLVADLTHAQQERRVLIRRLLRRARHPDVMAARILNIPWMFP